MGRAAQAVFACVCFACGSRTELDRPVALGDASTPDVTVTCPAPAFPSCDAGPAPSEVCAPLHYSAGLAESCALVRSPCMPVDAIGVSKTTCPFGGSDPCLSPVPDAIDVFAVNRYGKGHIAAFCDITGLTGLVQELPLVAYLGGSKAARVATLGTYPCQSWSIGTFLGASLPAQYVGAPAMLADDFDVVILCASATDYVDHSTYGPLDLAWAPTFVAFVRDFGKGLLVAADYARNCASPPDVYAPLDAITSGAGFTFAVADFGYATMTIDSACVPDWPQ